MEIRGDSKLVVDWETGQSFVKDYKHVQRVRDLCDFVAQEWQ